MFCYYHIDDNTYVDVTFCDYVIYVYIGIAKGRRMSNVCICMDKHMDNVVLLDYVVVLEL